MILVHSIIVRSGTLDVGNGYGNPASETSQAVNIPAGKFTGPKN